MQDRADLVSSHCNFLNMAFQTFDPFKLRGVFRRIFLEVLQRTKVSLLKLSVSLVIETKIEHIIF